MASVWHSTGQDLSRKPTNLSPEQPSGHGGQVKLHLRRISNFGSDVRGTEVNERHPRLTAACPVPRRLELLGLGSLLPSGRASPITIGRQFRLYFLVAQLHLEFLV